MTTTEKKVGSGTITVAEAAEAFREEALSFADSDKEADILATVALLNYLFKEKPDLFEPPLNRVGKAAIVSSLS